MRRLLIIFALLCASNCATTLPVKPDVEPTIKKTKQILKQYKKDSESISKDELANQLDESNSKLMQSDEYNKAAIKLVQELETEKKNNAWKVSLVNWFIGAIIVLFLAVVAGLILRFSGYKLPFVT